MSWFKDDSYGDEHKKLDVKHPEGGYTYDKFDQHSLEYNKFVINFVSNNYGSMYQAMLGASYTASPQDIIQRLQKDAHSAWIMLGHSEYLKDAGFEGGV